jgi:hypothetical protein
MDGIGGGGGGSLGGLGGGSSLGSSSPIEKTPSIDSGADRGAKTKTPVDSVKVGKGEGKNAAKQSDKMVGGLANSFSAIRPPERSPEQIAREKELFNSLADRVTPGSEGSFLQGTTNAQDDAKELFQPEAKAGRDGSAVQDRFNKYMEESKRDARMEASLNGKDKDLLDVSISNPVAGKKETIWGGFSPDDLKK